MLLCPILRIFSNILWFKINPAYTRNLVQQVMKLCVLMVDFHDCTSVMELVLPAISICMVTIRQHLWRMVFKAKNINPELNYEWEVVKLPSKQNGWLPVECRILNKDATGAAVRIYHLKTLHSTHCTQKSLLKLYCSSLQQCSWVRNPSRALVSQ